MIRETLKGRMKLLGIRQTNLAEGSKITAQKISMFFKHQTGMSSDSLERILKYLALDLDIYQRRYELSCRAAEKLGAQGKGAEEIIGMSKEEMTKICEEPEILLFFDLPKEEMDKFLESKVIDYESTYPFFKIMVLRSLGFVQNVFKNFDRDFLEMVLNNFGQERAGRYEFLKLASKYVV